MNRNNAVPFGSPPNLLRYSPGSALQSFWCFHRKNNIKLKFSLLHLSIGFFINRFQPFIRSPSAGTSTAKCKPAVRRGSMPVFYFRRNLNHISRMEFLTGCPIPDSNPVLPSLTESVAFVMNVPVIAAARFKGHVSNHYSFCRQHIQITRPTKYLPNAIFLLPEKHLNFLYSFLYHLSFSCLLFTRYRIRTLPPGHGKNHRSYILFLPATS